MRKNNINIKVAMKLRDKLMEKKYKLKLDSVDSVVQKMYNIITKYKLWDELKEVNKK